MKVSVFVYIYSSSNEGVDNRLVKQMVTCPFITKKTKKIQMINKSKS